MKKKRLVLFLLSLVVAIILVPFYVSIWVFDVPLCTRWFFTCVFGLLHLCFMILVIRAYISIDKEEV
jgi:hypothetical protein